MAVWLHETSTLLESTIRCSIAQSELTLSCGRESNSRVEHRRMPRKVKLIDGPSIFSWASGTPSSVQVAIVIVRALAHSEVFGAPSNINHLNTGAHRGLPFGAISIQVPLQVR